MCADGGGGPLNAFNGKDDMCQTRWVSKLRRVLTMAPCFRPHTRPKAGFFSPGPGYQLHFFPNVERESYASLAGVYCPETGRSFPFRMQRERHTALPCRSTVRFELSVHFGWNLRTFFPTGEFNIARDPQQEGTNGLTQLDPRARKNSTAKTGTTTFCVFTWFHAGSSTSNLDAMQPWLAGRQLALW